MHIASEENVKTVRPVVVPRSVTVLLLSVSASGEDNLGSSKIRGRMMIESDEKMGF